MILVTLFILSVSCLDYCSFLFSGLPAFSIYSLCCFQNCAAWIIRKKTLTTSFLCFSLSTGFQSHKEFSTAQDKHAIKVLHAQLHLICDCLEIYTPHSTLHFASDTLSFQNPHTRLLIPMPFLSWPFFME